MLPNKRSFAEKKRYSQLVMYCWPIGFPDAYSFILYDHGNPFLSQSTKLYIVSVYCCYTIILLCSGYVYSLLFSYI